MSGRWFLRDHWKFPAKKSSIRLTVQIDYSIFKLVGGSGKVKGEYEKRGKVGGFVYLKMDQRCIQAFI